MCTPDGIDNGFFLSFFFYYNLTMKKKISKLLITVTAHTSLVYICSFVSIVGHFKSSFQSFSRFLKRIFSSYLPRMLGNERVRLFVAMENITCRFSARTTCSAPRALHRERRICGYFSNEP